MAKKAKQALVESPKSRSFAERAYKDRLYEHDAAKRSLAAAKEQHELAVEAVRSARRHEPLLPHSVEETAQALVQRGDELTAHKANVAHCRKELKAALKELEASIP